VLDGRVHAHLTFSNAERALGGHLEEGCTVLTFAVVVLADTPDANLAGWDAVGELKVSVTLLVVRDLFGQGACDPGPTFRLFGAFSGATSCELGVLVLVRGCRAFAVPTCSCISAGVRGIEACLARPPLCRLASIRLGRLGN